MIIPDVMNMEYHHRSRRAIQKNYPEFYEYVMSSFEGKSFSERLYNYLHRNENIIKTCHICGKPTQYKNLIIGYNRYCSKACQYADKDAMGMNVKKSQEILLRKYGSKSPFANENVRSKSKSTKLQRYGFEYYTNPDKITQTTLERYGVVRASLLDDTKNKVKQTNLERYGVEYSSQSPEVKEKAKQTSLERYGVENPSQLPEIREKAKQTSLERYGVEHYNNHEKAKQTSLERYGVEYPMQNRDICDRAFRSYKSNRVDKLDNLIGYDDEGNYIIRCPHPGECDKCKEKSFHVSRGIYYDRIRSNIEPCTALLEVNKFQKGGSLELFIRQILDKHNIKYISNDRSLIDGKELDIYIPEKHIAIECNGTYFHSSLFKDRTYHIDKFISCESHGIQLISLWEDWIKEKPMIIESMILSKIGVITDKVYARKCTVRQIPAKISNEFLDSNHIQGRTNSSIQLGLYHGDELVSVMTFSRHRGMIGSRLDKDNSNDYELSRFCSRLNTEVVGGAGKLLKYFITNYHPSCIYSFSSNDISNGNLYKTLGFETTGKISSAYWYVDRSTNRRYHRTSFSKSQIVRLGWKDKIDNSWTEYEEASKHGLLRIYDSGQRKWVLNVDKLKIG